MSKSKGKDTDDISAIRAKPKRRKGSLSWWDKLRHNDPELAERLAKIRRAYHAGELGDAEYVTVWEYCRDHLGVEVATDAFVGSFLKRTDQDDG